MKKSIALFILLSFLCTYARPAYADDCADILEVIHQYYEAKKWKSTLRECESYERNCSSSPEVTKIKKECQKHLRPAQEEQPKQAEQPKKEQPKQAEQPKQEEQPKKTEQPKQAEQPKKVEQSKKEQPKPAAQQPAPQPVQETPPQPPAVFRLNQKVYPCKASESEPLTVTFAETPKNWHISHTPEWIISENTTFQVRHGIVIFSSEDGHTEATITVEQEGKEAVFKADKQSADFPEAGGETRVQITANCSWDIYESPEWIELERNGNSLTIRCQVNKHLSDREGDVVLLNDFSEELRIVV